MNINLNKFNIFTMLAIIPYSIFGVGKPLFTFALVLIYLLVIFAMSIMVVISYGIVNNNYKIDKSKFKPENNLLLTNLSEIAIMCMLFYSGEVQHGVVLSIMYLSIFLNGRLIRHKIITKGEGEGAGEL